MFKTIQDAIKVPEVKRRLLFTLLLLIVFRFGSHISVPFVDFNVLNNVMNNNQNGILGLVNLITGGAFARLSIFAMSISPYISASIIVQLLGMLIPSLEMMMKEGGEQGKKQINKYTKIITFVLALVQSLGLFIAYRHSRIFTPYNGSYVIPGIAIVLSLLAGTTFLVWVGEKITKKGIGNGISMLIFAGIVSSVPNLLFTMISQTVQNGTINVIKLISVLGLFIGILLLITSVVYVHIAERKIPIQYSRKIVGRKMYGGQNTFIPIKPVMAGVMPVIFASSFITFPAMIIQIFFANQIGKSGFANWLYTLSVATTINNASIWYILGHALVYMILIIAFTFFYTLAVFNPDEIATNIRQNGGYIPGVRAGKPTNEFLSQVVVKLTAFGSLFLCVIAIIPMLVNVFLHQNLGFGGTSILIIVGVAIETVQQLESQLMVRKTKGFLE
ncbi:MAG: preprotein translocase subunit SecY [Clostridium sp.]